MNNPPEMKTAEQHNAPQIGKAEVLSADQIRTRIVDQFQLCKPHLDAYHDYALRIVALSEEYHKVRLSETFKVPIEEFTLVASLDLRETPASLDAKLAELREIKIKRIIFDRVNHTYHLYV